jgi:hypothetical protein
MCSAQVCVLHSNFQQQDFIAHLEKGETMPNYRVLISDNGQFMREDECSDHGVFSNAEAAVTACKKIVDDDLKAMWKPGSTAAHLYTLFIAYRRDKELGIQQGYYPVADGQGFYVDPITKEVSNDPPSNSDE